MKQLREQISDVDRSLIEAINRRLKLVARLKRYKDDHGIAFVDPEREEWMFAYQSRANRGPLSDEGLRAFYAELLALTKREVT
jgi:chorismate mutase / prephenate dehydratase